MEFTYENQGSNTYLVYRINATDEVDTMSLGMLTNNKITGLIPAIFTQMDEDKFIKYNVSAKVSVKQFFSGVVNKKRLIGVFTGIVNAMISAEEYMINPANISLDLDYIYTDVSTCETNLICLPIVAEEEKLQDLGFIFKSIVFSTQFDQTENCDYVAKILNYLNSSPIFSLEDFKKVLNEIDGKGQQSKHITQAQEASQSAMPQQTLVSQHTKPTEISKPAVSQKATPLEQKQFAQPQQMNIPQKTVDQKAVAEPRSQEEKHISMMMLLTHYNKENKELYKKQKKQKKNAAKKKVSAVTEPNAVINTDFAIPGRASATIQQPVSKSVQKQSGTASMIPAMSAKQEVTSQPVQQSMHQSMQQPAQQPIMQTVPQVRAANFGETTVLNVGNHIGETTVLSSMNTQVETRPMLYRTKTNEKIVLDKPVFRIGKEKSYVDYFIGDNTAISRSHANILTKENEYYIVDTNSTNHTYVNGIMIQSNVETKLTHGTKIQLANEEFEFRMY